MNLVSSILLCICVLFFLPFEVGLLFLSIYCDALNITLSRMLYAQISPISIIRVYLHDCFLIVIPAQISNQVYTNVVRNVNSGRYNHNLSPGLRNLKSTP